MNILTFKGSTITNPQTRTETNEYRKSSIKPPSLPSIIIINIIIVVVVVVVVVVVTRARD